MKRCCQSSPRQSVIAPPESKSDCAEALLASHGLDWADGLTAEPSAAERRDALLTGLMELYRRTGSKAAFDLLAQIGSDQLLRRVRLRSRHLGERVDPNEILQDALVNICRYPTRFDARRPNAFSVWSATIVDNAIRRHVRRPTAGPDVRLQPIEILTQRADVVEPDPESHAIQRERVQELASAWGLLLQAYLQAYRTLSERERFVLQMVEVEGMRYAPLAERIGIRPEALKMVVFRARRRILERMTRALHGSVLGLAA